MALDFMQVATKPTKGSGYQVYAKFKTYPKPKDLLIRGKDFYAIWVDELGLWSTDEDVALRLIDMEIERYINENADKFSVPPQVLYMWDSESGGVDAFHKYVQKQMRDTYIMLDEKLTFSNTRTTRESYVSKKLPYPLEAGDISSWDKIISTLYSPEERHKIEWAIGSIVSGDSKELQKFMVFYGSAGTGKSTILNIVQQLFDGYCSVFDAKALGSPNNQFALESFKKNPLVAIQHDGDLSRIEDNTRLNSLVSHETMSVNAKFQGIYEASFKAFLFMGTNRPVKITDAKSGLLRRLIDVTPTGKKLGTKEYRELTKKVSFELGGIAYHCLQVYKEDPHYYDSYVPKSMMGATNDFYDFICDSYSVFKKEDGTTLKSSWEMYKTYVDEARVAYPFSKRVFKEELKNYFWNFEDNAVSDDGTKLRSWYSGFRTDIFENEVGGKSEKNPGVKIEETRSDWLNFKEQDSIFDKECADCLAQLANSEDKPVKKWADVISKLRELDTSKVHYVKVPENHIVIDFDIKDAEGNKSFDLNLEAASNWPATYAELSKSGGGIHLHYIYTGDVTQLSRIYDEDIEVKVFTGGSSLRRRLLKCNNLQIATLSSGLPLKEGGNKMINFDGIKNERMLRDLLKRHINKEIMGNTAPSVQMIKKVLDEAYEAGYGYDVSDLRNDIYTLALSSNNQSEECLKLANNMKFKSEEASEVFAEHKEIVFFDCEVFSNLFLICWKIAGEGKPIVKMINPKPYEVEELLKFKLIGFNCRRYDNHMLHACLMGYTPEAIYNLSQKIIGTPKGEQNRYLFGEAYNYSYTDIYDFAAKKQSLKKWEVELGIHHQELGLRWDEPAPEDKWDLVAEYCCNDVIATEATFNHLKGDFLAREILADLAGGKVNDTTNSLTQKIVFGNERKPRLVYTDLATGEQFE